MDWLNHFCRSGAGSKRLNTSALYESVQYLGYEPDEWLPQPEYPGQRQLSDLAFLQIAMDLPSDIVVLNLKEFSDLVAAIMRDQYPAFAGFNKRMVSLNRLREFSHMVMRDPAGLLGRETSTT